jgi:hypothetical protein
MDSVIYQSDNQCKAVFYVPFAKLACSIKKDSLCRWFYNSVIVFPLPMSYGLNQSHNKERVLSSDC